MAEKRKKEIETDDFVDRLADERGKGLMKLVGRFLGKSEKTGYYRLYMTEQLNRYCEFAQDATLEAERFPSGRIVVWLKAGTVVEDVTVRTRPEDFVTGGILGQYGGDATGVPGSVRMMARAAGDGCGSSIANCPDTQLTFTCQVRDPSPNCPYNPGPFNQ
jgi:hypothetical protein